MDPGTIYNGLTKGLSNTAKDKDGRHNDDVNSIVKILTTVRLSNKYRIKRIETNYSY